MKNRWDQKAADAMSADGEVGLRVYTSNLLGQDADLVLHGGGNTSVKGRVKDIFGESVDVLYVKGSGWDLNTIEAPGFPAVRLQHLLKLGGLESLSDSDMMRQLRLGLRPRGRGVRHLAERRRGVRGRQHDLAGVERLQLSFLHQPLGADVEAQPFE